MAHVTPSEEEVVSTLSALQLSSKSASKTALKPKSGPVAESWEDELSSGSATETEDSSPAKTSGSSGAIPIKHIDTNDLPSPPPPTPASPNPFPEFLESKYGGVGHTGGLAVGEGGEGGGIAGGAKPDKRPEKTTAVAGRMIAGALGVRAPKRTEEEREYDKKMREKERRKRDEERERAKREKEEIEARKRSVWED